MVIKPVFQDRWYQTEAVESIWDYFRKNTRLDDAQKLITANPLVALPTGTGKSVVIARFLQSVFQPFPQQRVMMLTHVKELIQQNYEKLLGLWPFAPAGIFSAGLGKKEAQYPITFAGIQSVWRKPQLFGHIDIVIIDEAHLLSPNDTTMYRSFLTALQARNPMLRIVGLTATPWRLGHGHLTDPHVDRKGVETPSLFTDVCYDMTTMEAFNRLIHEGFLIPLVPKPTKVILDTEGLHTAMGEFIEKEMQERFDRDEITEAALREAMEYAAATGRKKWLIFGSGTEHCDHIGEMLDTLGVSNDVVHSKRPGRDEAIAAFKANKITALVNNNVLTTGFDDAGIDLIIVLRATQSPVLWVQMLGRGTRPLFVGDHDLNTVEGRWGAIAEGGKLTCAVLDYARNTARLGPINDPVIPKRKGQGGGTAPVKQCDKCETYNHASARFCGGQPFKTPMGCGAEFSFEVKFGVEAAETELIVGDLPVVEVFPVDHITVETHHKRDKPPSMKISYYSKVRMFSDWIAFEHGDWAGRKAAKWWRERSDTPPPSNTAEAIERIDQCRAPTHIRVHTNLKYPVVLAYCYDGSNFGTEDPCPIPPSVERKGQPKPQQLAPATAWDDDDDIPF